MLLGAAGGGSAGYAMASTRGPDAGDTDVVDLNRSHPFYGQRHQGGVATDPQRHSVFMTFRFADSASTKSLQTLLARW